MIGAESFPGNTFDDMGNEEFGEYVLTGLEIVIPNLQYAAAELINNVYQLREITVNLGRTTDIEILAREARWLEKHINHKFHQIRKELKIE